MHSSSSPPAVLFVSLGGTITMTASQAGGVVPSLSADDLVSAVPGIENMATLRTETAASEPGASLRFEHLEALLAQAEAAIDDGAIGVIAAQGTDTIEESAYFLDLRWNRSEPLIVTGAMRPPGALSADGPSNVRGAVVVAVDPMARERGVMVVMDDQVHAASRVRKEHASALGAFSSGAGVLGEVVEGNAHWLNSVSRTKPIASPSRGGIRIANIGTGIDDDASLLKTVAESEFDGVVIDAFGVGHVSRRVALEVSTLARRMPVVIASRTGGGRTFADTYGFVGSEKDLLDRGALVSGGLDARKARVLLYTLMSAGFTGDSLATEFASRAT